MPHTESGERRVRTHHTDTVRCGMTTLTRRGGSGRQWRLVAMPAVGALALCSSTCGACPAPGERPHELARQCSFKFLGAALL